MNHNNNYARLGVMFVLHLIAMYVLMYAMVDTVANIHPNHNQLYMAALMASPMVILELLLMGSMYPNKRLNMAFMGVGVLVLVCSFFFIRQQTAIADEQFLKSMIPHHAGAVLMCNKASIEDVQIQELCRNIVSGQEAEIEWMEAKLTEIESR